MSSENELMASAMDANEAIAIREASELGPECMVGYRQFDWQAYVPECIRAIWGSLSLESRLVAFVMARQVSHADELSLDD